ncbi:MAG: tetratricopeptide repeat protein [Acidobacteriota bacterium]
MAEHHQETEVNGRLKAALAAGGFHAVAGSPPAVLRRAETAAGETGRSLLRLDLDGWEPESEDLESFLDLRMGLEGFEAASAVIGAAPEAAAGLFAAAGVGLFRGQALIETSAELVAELEKRSAEGPVAVVRDAGDTIPEPLRQVLRELAGERVAVIDGTRGSRGSTFRVDEGGTEDPLVRIAGVEDVRARRVLEALAIIGRPFPLEPLLELLVQNRAEHEETIDVVDDVLDEELGLVEDLGFIHPHFEHSLYRLTDPLWGERLLAAVDVKPRAEALLAFLRQRLEPVARTTSLVLARLADLADRGDQARRVEARLRWWAPASELTPAVEAAVAAGELGDPELVRMGADGVLSPSIRLAVLDVHQSADVSPQFEGLVWLNRARALRDGHRLLDAIEAVGRAVEWHELNRGRQDDAFLEARLTAGRLLLEAQDPRAARDQLSAARDLAASVLDEKDPRRAVLASEFGRSLMALGELRSAREPLEEALRRNEERFGDGHPNTVASCNNLAALLIDIGELEEARDRLLQAVQGAKKAGLPVPLRISLWSNLSVVSARLGDGSDSVRLLEQFTAQIAGESTELAQLLKFAGAPDNALPPGGLRFGYDFDREFEAGETRLLEEIFGGRKLS